MNPIALFLSDTHLKENNQDLVYSIFEQAIDICEDLGLDTIFHGGDFFNNRSSISLGLISQTLKIVELLEKSKINFFIIPGNHDKTNQDSENSYLDIIKHRKNINILSSEKCIHLEGITVSFLPYFTESYSDRLQRLKKSARAIGNSKNILITHIGINGVRNNDGTIVEDSNDSKNFKFWDKVLVGHYHDSQSFDNIVYTGSAYQANYGERLDDKGFHLIYDDCSVEFLPSKYTRYIKVNLDINDDIDTELEMYAGKGDNVRFVFSGENSDIHKIDKQKLDSLGVDFKLELNNVNKEIVKIENGDFTSMSKKNVISYFKEYCQIQEIGKSDFSRGLKILINQ